MLRPLALLAAALACAAATPLAPANVLIEYMQRPTLETPHPRFFWTPLTASSADRGVAQAAYRVIVTPALGGAPVWDSGRVASAASTHIPYAGAPLASDTVYDVAVTWEDASGATSPPGAGQFATGLLAQAEWAPAAWLGCPLHTAGAPNYNQLRTEFDLGLAPGVTIVQARAYVAAVGYAALRVNGQAASHYTHGQRVRNDPAWSTYELRAFYSAYDVTALLAPRGPNALALWQADGWPDIGPVPGNRTAAAGGAGERASAGDNVGENRATRLLLSIRDSAGGVHQVATTAGSFAGGSGSGSGGWSCGAGALQYTHIYNGCTWDQRNYTTGWDLPNYAPQGGAPWVPAVLRADPGGEVKTVMTSQAFPAVAVQEARPALTVTEAPTPGVYIFDMGQNLAGFVRLTLPAPVDAGVTITLRHAELLQHPPYGPADGSIYVGNLRSARATDVYTTGGASEGAEVWEPPIGTYHGFRFVEVSGLPFPPTLDTVTAVFIRSDVPAAGFLAFPPAANTLNQLQHGVNWAIGNNLMGVVSDCHQRDERKGWMGDSGLSLQPTHYNYAMGAFYTYWALQIRDAQRNPRDPHPPGSVPDTVPHTFGDYPSDPAWGTAYPGVVHSTWRMLGDAGLAAEHYPDLQLYIDFMLGEVNKTGIGQLYQSYGDWCPPGPQPPKHYTSGVALLQDMQRMIELATALGKGADAAAYAATRAALVADFNAAWLAPATGKYSPGDGLQTANAAALALNLPPSAATAAVRAALAAEVLAKDSHWSTGIIGMRFLHTALTEAGNGSLAVDTLLQTSYPSFGYMFSGVDETPATSLWELPDAPQQGPGMNSRSHHMFASVGGWLAEDLVGIGQVRQFEAAYDPAAPDAVGFRHAVLFPRVTAHPNLTGAAGEYASVSGRYALQWSVAASAPAYCAADAPENAPVTLSCPGGILGVVFASFGTPSGSCSSGFAAGACSAANSSRIVHDACVGKASCTIDVSTTLFGDPCFSTLKHLDVLLNCSAPPASPPLQVAVTVPANARATVRLPFPASVAPAAVGVREGGAVVWGPGGYAPGVPGITGCALAGAQAATPVGLATLDCEVGSGEYAFTVTH